MKHWFTMTIVTLLFLLLTGAPQYIGGGSVVTSDPPPGRSPGPPLSLCRKLLPPIRSSVTSLPDNPYVRMELGHPVFDPGEGVVSDVVYRVALLVVEPLEFLLETPGPVPVEPTGENYSALLGEVVVCPNQNLNIQHLAGNIGKGRAWFTWKAPSWQAQRNNSVDFRLRFRLLRAEIAKVIQEINMKILFRKECVLVVRAPPAQIGLEDLPSLSPECLLLLPTLPRKPLQVTFTEMRLPGPPKVCSSRVIELQSLHQEPSDVDEDYGPSWMLDIVYRLRRIWIGLGDISFVFPPRRICGSLTQLSLDERTSVLPGPGLLRVRLRGVRIPGETFRITTQVSPPCDLIVGSFGGRVSLPLTTLVTSTRCQWRFHTPLTHTGLLSASVTGVTRRSDYISFSSSTLRSDNGEDATSETTMHCDALIVITDSSGGKKWQWCGGEDDSESTEVTSSIGWTMLTISSQTRKHSFAPSVTLNMSFRVRAQSDLCLDDQWVPGPHGVACFQIWEHPVTWLTAKELCKRVGGHLAIILDQDVQTLIDKILHTSAGFDTGRAYWIGASDMSAEGAFRWMDGSDLEYTNWFPGWSTIGPDGDLSNAVSVDSADVAPEGGSQPSDDGLSGQDCLELRIRFPLPGGKTAKTTKRYFWNDRRCEEKNGFLCQRPTKTQISSGLSPTVPTSSFPYPCNESIRLTSQHPVATFTSPGYPLPYPDGALCVLTVLSPPGMRLSLRFDDFRLEEGHGCPYDYVEVFDLGSGGETNKWCGDWSDRLKLLHFTTRSPRLRLIFASDSSHRFEGFKARIRIEDAEGDCSDRHLRHFGSSCFLFVTFPEVTWSIAQQICSGMKASLATVTSPEEKVFISRELVSSSDFSRRALYWMGANAAGISDKSDSEVPIWRWFDGSPVDIGAWSSGISGSHSNPKVLSCLSLQWSSGGQLRYSGLSLRSQQCTMLGGYVCKRNSKESGLAMSLNQTARGLGGSLSSPNFPHGYYPFLHYIVHIEGPQNTRILLHFTTLELELQSRCLYDYLELNDGLGQTKRFCGTPLEHLNADFVARGRTLALTFHSDETVSGAGFTAVWKAVDVSICSQTTLEANVENDTQIHSPNYPHFYLSDLDCNFVIEAPKNHRVWLRFSVLEVGTTSHDDKCNNAGDWLALQLGDDSTEPNTLRLCGNLTGQPTRLQFLSYGSKLELHMRSKIGQKGRGFSATFKAVSTLTRDLLLYLDESTSNIKLHHINFPLAPPPEVIMHFRLLAPPRHVIQLKLHPLQSSSCVAGDEVAIEDPFGGEVDNTIKICGSSWKRKKRMRRGDVQSPTIVISRFHWLILHHMTGSEEKNELSRMWIEADIMVLPDPNFHDKVLLLVQSGWKVPDIVDTCSTHTSSCANGGRCIEKNGYLRCRCPPQFTGLFCALTSCDIQPCLFGSCEVISEKVAEESSKKDVSSGFRCRCQPGYGGSFCDHRVRPCDENPCVHGTCEEKNLTFKCLCHAWWEGFRCERRIEKIPFKPLSDRMLEEPFWLGLIVVTCVMGTIGIVWCVKRHMPERLERLLAEDDKRLGTPSPRQRRHLSAPSTKASIADKRQLLQQLVTPTSTSSSSRGRGSESIQLRERQTSSDTTELSGQNAKETELGDCLDMKDPRAEKKVTFAQLLDRVSFELGNSTCDSDDSSLSLRPPLRRSHAQHDDSVDAEVGSDPATPEPYRTPRRLTKISSADSILNLLRNFTGGSSRGPSAPPSPQGSEAEDNTSTGLSTPTSPRGSLSLGLFPQPEVAIVQVPVLDGCVVTGGGGGSASVTLEVPRDFGPCLSPIRELPTPLPSPMHTPMVHRHPPHPLICIKTNSEEYTGSESDGDVTLVVPSGERGESDGAETKDITTDIIHPIISNNDLPAAVPSITILVTNSDESDAGETHASSSEPPPSPSPNATRRLGPGFDSTPRSRSQSLEVSELGVVVKHTPSIFLFPPDNTAKQPPSCSPSTLAVPNATGALLSPLCLHAPAGNRAPSESNLSSSGYSSLASPAPSRCGSTTPLCGEGEDHSGATSPQRSTTDESVGNTSPALHFTVAAALFPPPPPFILFPDAVSLCPNSIALVEKPPKLTIPILRVVDDIMLNITESPDEGFEGDVPSPYGGRTPNRSSPQLPDDSSASMTLTSLSHIPCQQPPADSLAPISPIDTPSRQLFLDTNSAAVSSCSESVLSFGLLAPDTPSDAYDVTSAASYSRQSSVPVSVLPHIPSNTTSRSPHRMRRSRRNPSGRRHSEDACSESDGGGSQENTPNASPGRHSSRRQERSCADNMGITEPLLGTSRTRRDIRQRTIAHQIRFLRRIERNLNTGNISGPSNIV